jgi:hypothetical protein
MRSAARAEHHQATHAWHACRHLRLRPRAIDVLPQGLETSAGQQPTPDRQRSPGGVGGQVSPDHGHRFFWQGPGHEQRPYRGVHTGGECAPDVMEPEPLLPPFTPQVHLSARPIQAQDLDQRPRGGGQCGDEYHPIRQESSRRTRPPPRLWRLAPPPSPGDGRGSGRELRRQPPDGLALVLPGTPAVPLPRGLARCRPPWHARAGLARRRFSREGGGCDPPHDVRRRARRAGEAHTVTLPVVGTRDAAGPRGPDFRPPTDPSRVLVRAGRR